VAYRLEVVRNDLGRVSADARAKGNLAVAKTANDVMAFAAPFTPVDTGFLVGSPGIESGDLEAYVKWAAEYAIYQNMGTRWITGSHFAEQGAELARPGFEAAMEQVFSL
jgi:hypothetical protein